MNILLISMYSDKWNWKKQHKLYRKAIGKNAKLIIKRYYDKSGIRKVLDSRKINGIIISGSDYFVLKKGSSAVLILFLNIKYQYWLYAMVYNFWQLKQIKKI